MKFLIVLIALSSAYANARNSELPILFKCEQPTLHECHESYSNFEPAMIPMCGLGNSVRDGECPKGADFLGACRSAVQGGGGYLVQTVLFYYSGHTIGDAAKVEEVCRAANGEYIH